MYEYSEVRHHCPSVSFLFARLRVLLRIGSGCLEVGSFASESTALDLVLANLSPLLCQSLDWFRSVRAMSTKVRLSELDTSLSFSDKAIEVDTAVLTSPSLNPSSSSPTMLRAFHALKEMCFWKRIHSLDLGIGSKFLMKPGSISLIQVEKLAHSILGRCFYEATLLSSLKFPIHPFIMELFHHLGIAPGQLMLNFLEDCH